MVQRLGWLVDLMDKVDGVDNVVPMGGGHFSFFTAFSVQFCLLPFAF